MKYRTIVVDPPWRYGKGTIAPLGSGRGRSAEHHYPTMGNAEIRALPVGELAAANAHLYLWVTNPRLYGERDGDDSITPHDLIKAWGFTYKTCLTWVKRSLGLGFYFRGKTEHVLFATRGNAPIEPSNRIANVFETEEPAGACFLAPLGAGGHSSKPDVFYDLVEASSPGPYLELFARRQRLGWDTWGNECFTDVAL